MSVRKAKAKEGYPGSATVASGTVTGLSERCDGVGKVPAPDKARVNTGYTSGR